MITLKLMNETETRELIDKLQEITTDGMSKAIAMGTLYIENDAKRLAPKDLMNLANDIGHEIIQDKTSILVKIGATDNVKYAKYQEYGTRPHLAFVGDWGKRHGFNTQFLWVSGKAQPFLAPALAKNKKYVRDLLVKACTEGWGVITRKSK